MRTAKSKYKWENRSGEVNARGGGIGLRRTSPSLRIAIAISTRQPANSERREDNMTSDYYSIASCCGRALVNLVSSSSLIAIWYL